MIRFKNQYLHDMNDMRILSCAVELYKIKLLLLFSLCFMDTVAN